MVADVFFHKKLITSAKVKGFQARANRFKLIKNFRRFRYFESFYIRTHKTILRLKPYLLVQIIVFETYLFHAALMLLSRYVKFMLEFVILQEEEISFNH